MKNFPTLLTTPSGREVVLDKKRLLLAFRNPTESRDVASAIKEFDLVLEDNYDRKEKNKHWDQVNHTPTRFWVRSNAGNDIADEKISAIQNKLQGQLEWIGPVYDSLYNTSSQRRLRNKFCPLPNVILMEKLEQLKMQQDEILEKYHLTEFTEKSKYLRKNRYLILQNPEKNNAYQLRDALKKMISITGTLRFENMPMIKPLTSTIPNDSLWANQWNMTQINAPNAWDISTGANSVVICILDWGCDLTHPDLQFSEDGINLGTMMPTGAPTDHHGTACAGIAAATFNNNEGVAGMAGNCLIMPLAFDAATDVEMANGVNYAVTNGALVISMSFGIYLGVAGFDYDLVSIEIVNANSNDVVMCAATANDDIEEITFPAVHPLIIACGASSTDDNRKTVTSPDGECWGSNWGDVVFDGIQTGVSVVAPGVVCPSTDRQGADGYNNNGTLIFDPWACVSYPGQPANGNYLLNFDGTSAATPHVAGYAALLRSQYPALTNVQVRNIIERTAAKVGVLAYAEAPGFPNGTRNEEMGYGRIDAFQGLDFADAMIKDWSGDDGAEPSTPPSNNWWSYSDIVVRITDDDVFNPDNPSQSMNVERGQTNYIYIRVTNNGPHEARNVVVDFRITPYVGLQFIYPNDWTLEDAMHVRPTPVDATFASIASGASEIAKFTISSAQTDSLYGWQYYNPWHPCLLAVVTADNDYAFASSDLSFGNLVVRKNNIAQRNLSVIDVLASASASTLSSSFIAGNKANREPQMFIAVDRSKLPSGIKAYLSLDDDGSVFPLVPFEYLNDDQADHKLPEYCNCGNGTMVFLSRAKVKTHFGCCDGILTLEKGSSLKFLCREKKNKVINIKGGNLIVKNGKRVIEIISNKLIVEMERQPGEITPMSVQLIFPSQLPTGEQYSLSVSQMDTNRKTVGGGDFVYIIK